MEVIRGLRNLRIKPRASAVTIGVFDGVHIGHRRIITQTVKDARKNALTGVVVTFDPHPSEVIGGLKIPSLISLKHRISLIEKLGADYLVALKFTKAFSKMTPENFVKEILVGKLAVRRMYIGENFYLGKGAKAGPGYLKKISQAAGFETRIVKAVKVNGKTVSSSLIRAAITKGDLCYASNLLGRPVSVLGTVVAGSGLARYLGYPTANINPHHEVIPPTGVYAVRVFAGGKFYDGVLNIGVRPTFFSPKDKEPSIEVHIFGFSGALYGRDMEVYFVKKIREEKKFAVIADLKAEIRRDEAKARRILRKSLYKKIRVC